MLQMLEVIRLEGHSLAQDDAFVSRDIHLLQVLISTLLSYDTGASSLYSIGW